MSNPVKPGELGIAKEGNSSLAAIGSLALE
jgi:hypothetical protein